MTEDEPTSFLDEELVNRNSKMVNLALFRHFEEVDRCQTWHTEDDLRTVVETIRDQNTPQ